MLRQSGSYTRTKNSLRNSLVAVGLQVVALLIGFWSRRIFLNHLGTEVLGLNTTATSLLQFLNLAEMGIGSAIAVTLYKPIFNDDRRTIKEIVALQGWLYRIIALIVLGGSAVLMCFFPLIFNKTPLPLWYAYASFGVLLYSSLLGYFFNYKQILLDAHQQNYKIQLCT
ncbi:MAG: sugar transporter, partial [Bacteroidia bacterium]|nr:sugar transporter [Bacteroidia bacterium]